MVFNGEKVKHLRARMVVRGFKDLQWHNTMEAKQDAFSGTASRSSQRLILATAAQHSLDILCLDVAQAFLKGCTFQQLVDEYGQAPRKVQFRMPREGLAELKRISGFHDLNAETEALNMLRPGFGLNDAPKAWLLRLHSALRAEPLGL
eukprot:5248710-Amphidinium_carterae.1